MEDIDEICNSMMIQTKLLDAEEEWDKLCEMIETLGKPIVDLRKYMNEVSETIQRYEYTFIRDMNINSPECKYTIHIQRNTTKFIDMWKHYIQNEQRAQYNDLLEIRDLAFIVLHFIKHAL